jgi:hypothetical protein
MLYLFDIYFMKIETQHVFIADIAAYSHATFLPVGVIIQSID